jgi:hypothetical protein
MVHIKDPANGNTVQVTDGRQMKVFSQVVSNEGVLAKNGNVFQYSSPLLTVTNTKGLMYYLKNTSATKSMVITQFQVNWNGGSTNYNRPLEVHIEAGITEPTTNETAATALNTNSTSTRQSETTILRWDEVGTGMTGHTAGINIACQIHRQGANNLELCGAFIFGPGATLGFYCRGVETGEITISARWIETDFAEFD